MHTNITTRRIRGLTCGLHLAMLSCGLLWSAQHTQAQELKPLDQYMVRHWTKEQGAANTVLSICQTHDRYLWLGTYEGLFRYDGHTFEPHTTKNTPGLPDNTVRALLETDDSTLWIGTEKGLVTYKNGTFTPKTNFPHVIQALTPVGDSLLWVGTLKNGLWAYHLQRQQYTPVLQHLGNASTPLAVLDILVDAQSTWLATDQGLYTYQQGLFKAHTTTFRPAQGQPGSLATVLYRSPQNTLWVGTSTGLYYEENGRCVAVEAFSGKYVLHIIHDKQGNLLVGTTTGFYQFSAKGSLNHFTHEGKTAFHSQGALFDHEGNLWFLTLRQGLFQLVNVKFGKISQGLASDAVGSLGFNQGGELLVGSTNGKVMAHAPQGTRLWLDPPMEDRIYHVYTDSRGHTWASTYHGLVQVRPNGSTRTWQKEDGLGGNFCRYVMEDSLGRLWVGTKYSGISVLQPGKGVVEQWNVGRGLSSNFILDISPGPAGTLLVGTAGGGLNIIWPNGQVRSFSQDEDGLASNVVFHAVTDSAGVIWLATSLGISRLAQLPAKHPAKQLTNSSQWKVTTIDLGHLMPDLACFSFLEDAHGHIWLPSASGLAYVAKADLEAFAADSTHAIEGKLFTAADGMVSTNCAGATHAAAAPDGTLYIPTFGGVVVIKPAQFRTTPPPPPQSYITHTRLNQAPLAIANGTALPPGANRLTLQFTAPTYTIPEKMQLRYWLRGVDPGWILATSERTATYTNLGPGTYTFEVAATNAAGQWHAQPATLSFSIKPHLHQKPWFISLMGLLLLTLMATLFFLLFRWRVRYVRQRNRELEQQVAQRTQSLAKANIALAEQKEALYQQNEEIMQQRDKLDESLQQIQALDQFKEQMIGMVAHDLKNPLNVIMGLSAMEANAQRQSLIHHNSEQMLRLVLDMLDVQRMEEAKLKPEAIPITMHRLVDEVMTQVQTLMDSKQLHFRPSWENATVLADLSLVSRVLVNLFNNAIKHTPPQGTLNLSAECTGQELLITLTDTGAGIPPEALPHIFEKFYQGAPGQKANSSGLGLTFCRLVIEAHKGRIGADSILGQGTSIWFTLPLAPEQEGSNQEQPTPEAVLQPTQSIQVLPVLSPQEAEMLQEPLAQLQALKVYQLTEVNAVLATIEPCSPSVARWKETLGKTLFACNQAHYEQLLKTHEPSAIS